MKILSQAKSFETKTTLQFNDVLYIVTTRGALLADNKPSNAITFDFKRLDEKKLTKKEEQFSDLIFESILKDKHVPNKF